MSITFLLTLVHVNSVLRASNYGCPNAKDFEAANSKYFPESIRKDLNNSNLGRVFDFHGTDIGKGSYGEVKFIQGLNEKYAVKMLKPSRPSDHISVERELIFLKYICGVQSNKDFSEFIPCEGKAITPFKGCVESDDGVLIFQRLGHFSLRDVPAIDIYRNLKPIYRLGVILRILDKVIQLHDRGIIHSDIKPANIVSKDAFLEQIELIDLGMAGIDKYDHYGGTATFLAPEYLQGHLSKELSPQLDIYSLAITFMSLEKGFNSEYNKVPSICFKDSFFENCHKLVIGVAKKALRANDDFAPLEDIILKALSFKKNDRHASVVELSKALVDAAKNIRDYKIYFHQLVEEEEKKAQQSPQDTQIYKWVKYARESKLSAEKVPNSNSNNPLFCCGGKPKPVVSKPTIQQPQQPQQQPLTEQQILQRKQLLLIQYQLLSLNEKELRLRQSEDNFKLKQKYLVALKNLQAMHRQDVRLLKQTHQTSNLEPKMKQMELEIQQQQQQQREKELTLDYQKSSAILQGRHHQKLVEKRLVLMPDRQLIEPIIKDMLVDKQPKPDLKSGLNQEKAPENSQKENPPVPIQASIKNVEVPLNDSYEERDISESKSVKPGNYVDFDKNWDFTFQKVDFQNSQQQNPTGKKPHILI